MKPKPTHLPSRPPFPAWPTRRTPGLATKALLIAALALGTPAVATTEPDPQVPSEAPSNAPSGQPLIAAALALREQQPALFGDAKGVVALEVVPDSQADMVGLRPGDILLRYDGNAVATPDELAAATQARPEGTPVLLELLRDGRPLRIDLKAGRIGVAITAITEPATAASGDAGLYTQPVLVLDPGMHTAPIRHADVDRAGLLAVTGSEDKTLRLWALDGDLSKPLATLRVPAGPGNVGKVYAVAMAPAGDRVAAGGSATSGPPTHIYLFARDGQLVQRIDGLPNVVSHLAFSPDGRWLAAGLGGANGIRIYDRDARWAEAARDSVYGADVYGLAFAVDGRLATTSYDGQVRLYDAGFRHIARRRMTLGDQPYGIAFHPDGDRLAVGFEDTTAVLLLDANTLKPFPKQPGLTGIDNGNLLTVAWSRDGATLYAAGRYFENGHNPVLAWSNTGTGARRVVYRGALNTVISLQALPDGSLLVASQDPHLAAIGDTRAVHPSPNFDPRAQHSNLAVSADGLRVDFGFEIWGDRDRHRFDLAALRLTPLPAADQRTAAPRQSGLPITYWMESDHPSLDSKPLTLEAYEHSRSLAIHPDGRRFVLGTEWFLRAFDAAGEPLWHRAVPSIAWAVNISGDGRLVIAAYGDGTIRWHRMDDGRELLAFFPMPDRKNWVAWTPEGFYGATAGAHGVLRWHVNRGWGQLADTYPVSQFRYLRRPDALRLVLQEGETARALGLADMARAMREVQLRTHSKLPPGARLHLVGVGVGDYGEAARHLRLEYADDDVKDIASALLNTQSGLYAEVKPQILTNENATRKQVLSALDSVYEQMSPSGNDLAVFHFSGHGAMLGPPGRERYYLLPYDVDASNRQQLRNSAVPVSELRDRLAELGRKGRVLVLLDACHSGAATASEGALAADGAVLRSALAGMANVTVLTSSSSDKPSVEREDWKNGAFTEVLLRALGKEADTDQNGLISSIELTRYLGEHLPHLTDGEQQPGIELRFDSEIFVSDL